MCIRDRPKTVPELLQAARIAELTTPLANETNSGVSLQLAGVQEQLKKLTEKWDAQATNQATTAQATSEATASSAPLNKPGVRNANLNLPACGRGQRGRGRGGNFGRGRAFGFQGNWGQGFTSNFGGQFPQSSWQSPQVWAQQPGLQQPSQQPVQPLQQFTSQLPAVQQSYPQQGYVPVSYTHLTLPTIYSV